MLSEGAQRLLRGAVTSVWALELLLLLRKERSRALSLDELAKELRANPALVSDIAAKFMEQSLITSTSRGYQYQPADYAIDDLVSELAIAYAETPIAIIKSIAEAPNDKIRAFADAFKLKRE